MGPAGGVKYQAPKCLKKFRKKIMIASKIDKINETIIITLRHKTGA